MTQETLQHQLAGLISTLGFRPSAEHPEACMPIAAAILALIQSTSEVPVQRDERSEKLGEQLDATVAEVNANHRIISRLEERVRELDAAWLRHTWSCGHISEGTGDEPDRCRICVAEAVAQNWQTIISDEMAENVKLFGLLGVMPEIEAGCAGTDAVVDAAQKLKADLAATQAALKEKLRALKDIRALLVVRPHRFADQTEKIHAVLDAALAGNCGLYARLTAPPKEVMPFMLPAPVPATPIPPDPRDAVVEAAITYTTGDRNQRHKGWQRLLKAVHALRATEGRG